MKIQTYFNSKFYLICLPILGFLIAMGSLTVNIPWLDDFEVAPVVLYKWIQTDNWADKLSILWAPNNEHRVVLLKTLCVFNYQVFGKLNFQWMIWQSLWYLIPLFYSIWKALPKENKWFLFIPVPFLFLNLQYYLTSFWMISAIQHHFVIGFGVLSMYFLSKSKKSSFIPAIICSMFACISNSDGLFFIFIGLLVLIIQFRLNELMIWAVVNGLFLGLFFLNYPSMGYHETGIRFFLQNPLESLRGFFMFMGGSFDFWYHDSNAFRMYQTAFIGLVLIIMQILLIAKKVKKHSFSNLILIWKKGGLISPTLLFLFAMLLYCILNAIMISVLRSSFGTFVYLIGNYKIIPTFALVLSYLIWLHIGTRSKRHLNLVIGLSILFWAGSWLNSLEDVKYRKAKLIEDSQNFKLGKGGLGFTAEQVKKYELDKIMLYLKQKEVYSFN